MFNIRTRMFETNSSSVHKLVIIKTSDFKSWAKDADEYGTLEDIIFWDGFGSGQTPETQKFKSGSEFIEEMIKEGWKREEIDKTDLIDFAANNDYFTFENTVNDYEYDSVTQGDITAFSYSGWDG